MTFPLLEGLRAWAGGVGGEGLGTFFLFSFPFSLFSPSLPPPHLPPLPPRDRAEAPPCSPPGPGEPLRAPPDPPLSVPGGELLPPPPSRSREGSRSPTPRLSRLAGMGQGGEPVGEEGEGDILFLPSLTPSPPAPPQPSSGVLPRTFPPLWAFRGAGEGRGSWAAGAGDWPLSRLGPPAPPPSADHLSWRPSWVLGGGASSFFFFFLSSSLPPPPFFPAGGTSSAFFPFPLPSSPEYFSFSLAGGEGALSFPPVPVSFAGAEGRRCS